MTVLRRLDLVRLLPLGLLLLLPAGAGAQQRPPAAENLAKTYGLAGWGQIEAIRYTFNAELPGINLARTWIWEPKTGQVTYEATDKEGKPVKVTYLRSQLGGQPAEVREKIEPAFVNDEYWLVLPFHAVWDKSAAVEDAGQQKLPQGQGSADKIVIKYPSEGGYSAGDTWDLYVGGDGRVEQMVFHRGGAAKPSLVIAAWTEYRKAGPLLVAHDHRGTADGQPVRVFFSNVAVKLAGSSDWLDAR